MYRCKVLAVDVFPTTAVAAGAFAQVARITGQTGGARTNALTKAERDRMTPAQVLDELKNGNERFRTGKLALRDYRDQQRTSAAGQYPTTAVLGCIDSRAPAELIFDAGIGDTFNARIAGNVVNDDLLGSLEFACAVAGAKVLLLLGHTACGAIKGAIDDVEMGNLTGLLARVKPAITATTFAGGEGQQERRVCRRGRPDECPPRSRQHPPAESDSRGPGEEEHDPNRRGDVRPGHRHGPVPDLNAISRRQGHDEDANKLVAGAHGARSVREPDNGRGAGARCQLHHQDLRRTVNRRHGHRRGHWQRERLVVFIPETSWTKTHSQRSPLFEGGVGIAAGKKIDLLALVNYGHAGQTAARSGRSVACQSRRPSMTTGTGASKAERGSDVNPGFGPYAHRRISTTSAR